MSEGIYNFHDMLLVHLSGSQGKFAKVDKEYSYYQSGQSESNRPVDISFDMSSFSAPAMPRAVTVDKKYQVAEQTLYAADRYKVAFWKVLLQGLDDQTISVRFHGNSWSMVIASSLGAGGSSPYRLKLRIVWIRASQSRTCVQMLCSF